MSASGGPDTSCYEVISHALAGAGACTEVSAQARAARAVSRLVITEDLQESFRLQLAGDPP
jgi:hypothetical protein